MVAEIFTIFVTQLLTFKWPCSDMQIHRKQREALYSYINRTFTAFLIHAA